jgi:23S rRNA pseudouridine1911/1915/1917 synthase
MPISHIVEHPAELLAYLFARHPQLKKGTVRQWLKHGSVYVNGSAVSRFDHVLEIGDVVSIRGKKESVSNALLPTTLNILFEDASLVVIEKPAGLLSMANDTQRHKTAYAFLTDYVRRGNSRSNQRVWIVHRLDREASGLMVFAKSEAAKRTIQANWQTANKRYLAVVEGSPPEEQGELRSYLNECNPFKVFSAPSGEQTRLAITQYRVIKRNTMRALVELILQTGRRNQIRVQLADAGCPIIGDRKYGALTNPARRLALHASALRFHHPAGEELLQFESPLPRTLGRLV